MESHPICFLNWFYCEQFIHAMIDFSLVMFARLLQLFSPLKPCLSTTNFKCALCLIAVAICIIHLTDWYDFILTLGCTSWYGIKDLSLFRCTETFTVSISYHYHMATKCCHFSVKNLVTFLYSVNVAKYIMIQLQF